MLAEITAAMTIMMHRNTLLPHILLFAFNVKGHYLLFSIAACLLKFFKNATRIDSKVVRSVHSWRQEEKRARLAHFLFPKVSQSQHAHIRRRRRRALPRRQRAE